jgi:hypothetical protein
MSKKREDDAPLDALRLVLDKHAVQLSPTISQVSTLPQDPQLEYYFVPMQYMEIYRPYHRPGKPMKNLKLINFERPAVSLSFYTKHKYTIERNVDVDQVIDHLKNHRDELLNRSLVEQLSPAQMQELQQNDELLRSVRQMPEGYQFCFSNYHHYYRYWYCTFRYFADATLTQLESDNEHLLKHTERVKNLVHQRLNIIFIDPHYISRPVPYDNRFVDRELANYPTQVRQGITTLYIRKS